jgi:hypothetical protein
MSDWSETIEYINSFPNEKWAIPLIEIKSKIGGNYDTITLYVSYLYKAGFLIRTGRGIYRKVHNIPLSLTLTQLKNFAYPKGTTWEDRKMIVERYWKLHNIKDKIVL